MVSHHLSKEFGLKSYKPAAKPKKKRLSYANKHLYWTMEKLKSFILLTNLQFSNLQWGKGMFEKPNYTKDSMQSTTTISKVKKTQARWFGGHEQTWDS